MTEVERLKVQIALLEEVIEVIVGEKHHNHKWAEELGEELEDQFGRRLAALKSDLRLAVRNAIAANPSGGSPQGTPPQADAVRA